MAIYFRTLHLNNIKQETIFINRPNFSLKCNTLSEIKINFSLFEITLKSRVRKLLFNTR
jgi:hypothetical protein